jgi:hypothetical protein
MNFDRSPTRQGWRVAVEGGTELRGVLARIVERLGLEVHGLLVDDVAELVRKRPGASDLGLEAGDLRGVAGSDGEDATGRVRPVGRVFQLQGVLRAEEMASPPEDFWSSTEEARISAALSGRFSLFSPPM